MHLSFMRTSPKAEYIRHVSKSSLQRSASHSLNLPHKVTSEGNSSLDRTEGTWERGEILSHTCVISECSGISNNSICCSCACAIKDSLMSSEVQWSNGTGITWRGRTTFPKKEKTKQTTCRKQSIHHWSWYAPQYRSASSNKTGEHLSVQA